MSLDSMRRTAGSANRAHSAYIAAEGCRPSSASIAGSAPRARLTGAISMKATPRSAQIFAAAAL